MPDLQKLILRFKKRTRFVDNHWIWDGAINRKTKHGLVTVEGRQYYIHRLIFCLSRHFDYDDKFFACHMPECNIAACWNPDHIYVGTNQSNQEDVVRLGYNKESIKTHCPLGHEYTVDNTRWNNNKRICKECSRIRDRNRVRYTINGRRYTKPGTRRL